MAGESCDGSLGGCSSQGGALLHGLGLIFPFRGWAWKDTVGPYDLAIFPHRCQLSLGGYPLAIQTYPWDKSTYGNGKKYIATAYVVSSTQ